MNKTSLRFSALHHLYPHRFLLQILSPGVRFPRTGCRDAADGKGSRTQSESLSRVDAHVHQRQHSASPLLLLRRQDDRTGVQHHLRHRLLAARGNLFIIASAVVVVVVVLKSKLLLFVFVFIVVVVKS